MTAVNCGPWLSFWVSTWCQLALGTWLATRHAWGQLYLEYDEWAAYGVSNDTSNVLQTGRDAQLMSAQEPGS